MNKLLSILALAGLIVSGCTDQTPQKTETNTLAQPEVSRPALDQLSQSEAIARKERVSNVSYILDIDLVSQSNAYQGQVTANFDLRGSDSPLTIDFTGGSVSSVEVNDESIAIFYNDYFVTLPADALLEGPNKVTITYTHPFDQDGTGLHRFIDPEDGNTYLYTYLWPYYSNRLFPNFDQPNIKATYQLSVRAAKDWQVVSATTENSVVIDGDTSLWTFPVSEKFSSYVFSLHAGPYHIWEDQAGDIPIRLMARQSLAQYVAVEEWMNYTKSGLAHFRNYFEIPYPFKKYDQVIVPDFLIGAMENVAAVTFSESYVDRGAANRFNSQRRAGTILHEMAHMWFGDLVTNNWWNGLWLNESFATLMSAIAVSESTEFEDLWHDFYLSENLTAIGADKAVSTHPIEVPVVSSNDFFNVFDAITYDKGASVLNQLSRYIGREDFRLGVSNYLTAHSWSNTELADFIDALAEQSGTDLASWSQNWLYKAGVNKLSTQLSCENGTIDTLSLIQTANSEYPTLRNQRIQVALFSDAEDKGFPPTTVIPVDVSGASTDVDQAIGLPCPLLVLPNYEGWGYAEVALDEISMNTIIDDNVLALIDDPLTRSMIWTALFDAPKNLQMDNNQLLATVITNLPLEQNDRIIRQTLSELSANLNNLERLGSDYLFQLTTYSTAAEDQLWKLISRGVIEGAEAQSESTLNLRLRYYRDIARSSTALGNLNSLLNGEIAIPGLEIGQGLRWSLVTRLAARDYPNARDLIAQEQERDPSDAGRRAYFSAQASLPNLEIKRTWVQRFLDSDDPLPLSNQRSAMSSIFPTGQEDLQLALLPTLAENLAELGAERDNYYLRSYGSDLFAGVCSEEGLAILEQALASPDEVGPTLFRFINENRQSAQQCLAQKNR
ncbi:MAG: aminopeptidase N [Pseudohongiellaceae bacterium]